MGLEPDLLRLEREPMVTIVERLHDAVTAVLLRVPEDRVPRVRKLFRGVCHVYDTEDEARRAWRLFGE